MICPICETANADGAAACELCGKLLAGPGGPEPESEIEPLEGREPTQLTADPLEGAFPTEPDAPLEGLEPTQLFDPRAEVPIEPLELASPLPEGDAASQFWTPELPQFESGRVPESSQRTPAPAEDGPCPWCGFPGSGLVCNNCGRRRKRYTGAPELESSPGTSPDQTMLCPSCFTRVLIDVRCAECMAPLPRPELL